MKKSGIRLIMLALFTASAKGQISIDTIAGAPSLDGLKASDIVTPVTGRAVAPDGSIYFTAMSMVWRIDPGGVVHHVAGTGVVGFSGDGGPATQAKLWSPLAATVDSTGNYIFADRNRIRKISPNGIISTIAGNGYPAGSQTNGPALSVPVTPQAIAADSKGNVYFIESGLGAVAVPAFELPYRIRRLAPGGTSVLFAGNTGDGSGEPADPSESVDALALSVRGTVIATGPDDSLYLSAFGRVFRISPSGTAVWLPLQSPNALNTTYSMAVDATGNIYLGTLYAGTLKVSPQGAVTTYYSVPNAALCATFPLGFDPSGKLVIQGLLTAATASTLCPAPIYRVSGTQSPEVVTGTATRTSPDGTLALGAQLELTASTPIAVDSRNRLVLTERKTCRLRTIDSGGRLGTLAGTGNCALTAKAGPALTTDLCVPQYLAAAPSATGSVYIRCSDNSTLRLDAAGQLSVLSISGASGYVAADSLDSLYTEYSGSQGTGILRVTSDEKQTLARVGLSGVGNLASSKEGAYSLIPNLKSGVLDANSVAFLGQTSSALDTRNLPISLYGPLSFLSGTRSMASAGNGVLYISNGQTLARVDWGNLGSNLPLTIIGSSGGHSGDGGPAAAAGFSAPGALATDSTGNLIVVDYGSQRIRKLSGAPPATAPSITPGGIVNSASYVAGPPSGLFSIFGSGLAATTEIATLNDVSIPTALGGTRVLVNGFPAWLLAVTPGQINAIMPVIPFSGQYSFGLPWIVRVDVDGKQSASATFSVVTRQVISPGLFAADGSGKGPGAILNQDGSPNSASLPALKGSVVSLYGTGFIDGGARGVSEYRPTGILGSRVTVRHGRGPTSRRSLCRRCAVSVGWCGTD